MISPKTALFAMLLCGLLIVAGCGVAAPSPTPTPVPTPTPTTARFEGTIYFLDKPFAGAKISLNDPAKDTKDPAYIVAEATTDAQGRYSFVVDPGNYVMGATLVIENPADYACQRTLPIGWIASQASAKDSPAGSPNPWLAVWGSRPDGAQVLIASSDSIKVQAGEIVQRDMYATCET